MKFNLINSNILYNACWSMMKMYTFNMHSILLVSRLFKESNCECIINMYSAVQPLFFWYIAHRSQFKTIKTSTAQGLPYNFASIMHFRHNAYSKNLLSTIIPINESIEKEMLGRRQKPSEQDYLDINLSYCGEKKQLRMHVLSFFFNSFCFAMHKVRYKVPVLKVRQLKILTARRKNV